MLPSARLVHRLVNRPFKGWRSRLSLTLATAGHCPCWLMVQPRLEYSEPSLRYRSYHDVQGSHQYPDQGNQLLGEGDCTIWCDGICSLTWNSLSLLPSSRLVQWFHQLEPMGLPASNIGFPSLNMAFDICRGRIFTGWDYCFHYCLIFDNNRSSVSV